MTRTETRPATTAAPALQETLVELIDLALQGKQAHWTLVGPDFAPVHQLLDAMVDEYRVWYDDVAERMAAIGIPPDGRSTTVAATTSLAQVPAGWLSDRAVLQAFEERVGQVSGAIASRAAAMDADLASQDLLVEVLRGIDKQRWMLRAHLA
jgi:starvation-inducible DNA-binding protein